MPSDAGLGFPVEQEGTTDQVSMCVSALALQQWPRVCSKSASQALKLCNVVSCAVWHTTPLPSQEAVVMPYLTALADFREQIRKVALENKGTCTSYRLALLCRGHLINNPLYFSRVSQLLASLSAMFLGGRLCTSRKGWARGGA